jgi:membrane-associated phospholipid phosphatase
MRKRVQAARSPVAVSLTRLLGNRLLAWWPFKLAGTALGMTVFFPIYFWVLSHPWSPVTVMPLTALDHGIGFHPAALPLYLSLWLYVSLAPALIADRRELWSYGLAWVALSVVGLGIFMLWPTAVPPPDIDWSLYPSLRFLKAADATGNACPSLHVAFAVFSAVWFARLLRQMRAGRTLRTVNWLWCAGILYSTVAIRQHVVLDVLAGAALGVLVATAHVRWLGRFRSTE